MQPYDVQAGGRRRHCLRPLLQKEEKLCSQLFVSQTSVHIYHCAPLRSGTSSQGTSTLLSEAPLDYPVPLCMVAELLEFDFTAELYEFDIFELSTDISLTTAQPNA